MNEITLFALDAVCRRRLSCPLDLASPTEMAFEDARNVMIGLLLVLRSAPDCAPAADADREVRQAVLDFAVTGDASAIDNLPDDVFVLFRSYLAAIIEYYTAGKLTDAGNCVLVPDLPDAAAQAQALAAIEILENGTPQQWLALKAASSPPLPPWGRSSD